LIDQLTFPWCFVDTGLINVTFEHFLPIFIEPYVSLIICRIQTGKVVVELDNFGRIGFEGYGSDCFFIIVFGYIDAIGPSVT